MSDSNRSPAVIVAIIGIVGTIAAAVIANWDKLNKASPAADSSHATSSGQTSLQECVPKILSPAMAEGVAGTLLRNRTIESDWEFRWRSCPRATRYHLVIYYRPNYSKDVTSGVIKSIDTLTAPTYTFRYSSLTINPNEGFSVSVRAMVDGQWTSFSDENVFSILVTSASLTR